MRIDNIPAHEADFDINHVDSNDKYFDYNVQSIPIPGETKNIDYVSLKPLSGDESYYFKTKPEKKQIVLHYTLGYLKGDIATLTQHDYHVSVPFVIGRNGKIYNLFFSAYWAYHLGPGASGGNETQSKATIAIEISNIGGLIKTGGEMQTYYGDTYCDVNTNNAYIQKPFRRFEYYATFTDSQYESLILLLRYLTGTYNIKRAFLPEADRYMAKADVVDFNGIVSHVNYRKSDKEDIGPAFDWDRVIRGVTA
jgi:N-acetylmuramoyl-L-alanine amidase